MFRIARVLVPLTTIAAIAVLLMVVTPAGARAARGGGVLSAMHDRYVFNETIRIDEPVSGNLQVYFGTVEIANVVKGDLFSIGGNVVVTDRGRIEGNVIYAGGRIDVGRERVGGRVQPLGSLEGAAASMTKSAVIVSLLLFWLIAAVVLAMTNGRELRLSSLEVRASALHCFVVGLVALTSFVLTAIAFGYLVPYVIGIPLLAALGIFATLTKIYGLISVFHALGTLVAGAKNRQQLEQRRWLRGDVAMVVIGVLILGVIRLIPVVGTIVWGLASVFGVGVALATKFGKREPWFLAWRPAEA